MLCPLPSSALYQHEAFFFSWYQQAHRIVGQVLIVVDRSSIDSDLNFHLLFRPLTAPLSLFFSPCWWRENVTFLNISSSSHILKQNIAVITGIPLWPLVSGHFLFLNGVQSNGTMSDMQVNLWTSSIDSNVAINRSSHCLGGDFRRWAAFWIKTSPPDLFLVVDSGAAALLGCEAPDTAVEADWFLAAQQVLHLACTSF